MAMAPSSYTSLTPHKGLYTLSTTALFLLFILSLFYFSRHSLEPKLTMYRDLFSETHLPTSLVSPQSSTAAQFQDPYNEPNPTAKPATSRPEVDKFVEQPTPISSPILGGEMADSKVSEGASIALPMQSISDLEETRTAATEEIHWANSAQGCNFYEGTWVEDDSHPIYSPSSCPYVDEAFDCQHNGRPDSQYLKWRWKPDGCDLPRFNATDFLVRLTGQRLMFVGDSMNRNQFESLLCLLREGLVNKSKMYEIHGYKITKGRGYYIFKFEDYNCTVEFVRSHFLVKEGVRINAQGKSNPTLSIDCIDKTAPRWKRADILIFNTGHWWTHGKTSRGKNYYKEGDYIYPKFDAVEAYRIALKTWASWIDKHLERKKMVFYRGYSSAHFRGGDWDAGGTCNGESQPVLSGTILDNYPVKMKIVEEVIKEMQTSVVLLNVTRLTNFRKDGHPSVYGKTVTDVKKVSTKRQDCSHWCLPGVPDTWNELIYASLVLKQTSINKH